MDESCILKLENLHKSFGGLVATDDVSLYINHKEIVGLIGPNGAGKTTLFNLISGFFPPNSGIVLFKNKDITGLKPHQICKQGISRTFQIQKPLINLSVFKNVMVGAYNRLKKKEAEEKTEETLVFTGLWEKKESLAKHLTLADRKSLELARAIACQPQLILLDETAAGLTQTETKIMVDLIRKIQQSGITIFMIEHVMKAIMSLSDRIYVIHHGKKISDGTPLKISKDPVVINAYLGEEYVTA